MVAQAVVAQAVVAQARSMERKLVGALSWLALSASSQAGGSAYPQELELVVVVVVVIFGVRVLCASVVCVEVE